MFCIAAMSVASIVGQWADPRNHPYLIAEAARLRALPPEPEESGDTCSLGLAILGGALIGSLFD